MCPRADASEVDRRIAIPAALAAALLPFQTAGLRFGLERCGRILLADEMGVGKTVQAIALMAAYHVRIALPSVLVAAGTEEAFTFCVQTMWSWGFLMGVTADLGNPYRHSCPWGKYWPL